MEENKLAEELTKAPVEIRQAMAEANLSHKRLIRAETQYNAWVEELKRARELSTLRQAELADLLNRWDTVSPTLGPSKLETLI